MTGDKFHSSDSRCIGWRRRSEVGRWAAVAFGDTARGCHQSLADYLLVEGGYGLCIVLRRGVAPESCADYTQDYAHGQIGRTVWRAS
jgi:hypothetical protein